ncbi:YeiH family protein [Comamonas sp.]|uniref:YeiH family protein n=1 Tax=Comamonas sp. TaxID=34028 RepID=UPI002899AC9A|nr:YeiH family protein [Comamonas sp.]
MSLAHLPLPRLRHGHWLDTARRLAPGLLLCAAIAWLASVLAALPWFGSHGLSALTVAIVIGMLVGNTVYGAVQTPAAAGVGLSKQQLLRLGIILYGLRLTFQDIAAVGLAGVLTDALMLISTFVLAQWLGRRWLGLDARTSMLVGAGSAICGAAAVLATAPVAKARADDVAVAIATVVVFGTVGTFLYPVLYQWLAPSLQMTEAGYGLWVGSTVHEVAQVVAAGGAVSSSAADTAVVAKMVRVMMLAPFLIALSLWLARRPGSAAAVRQPAAGGAVQARQITIPWFALGFVAVAGIHSLGVIPAQALAIGVQWDNALLTMAMAGLGLTTHVRAVRAAGIKPLLLGLVLFVWLVLGGLAVNTWL